MKNNIFKVNFEGNAVKNIEEVDNTFNAEDDVLFVVEKDDEEILITKAVVDGEIKYFENVLNDLDDMVFHDDMMEKVEYVTDLAITDVLHDAYYALQTFIFNVQKIMDDKMDEVEDKDDVVEKLVTHIIENSDY